MATSITQATTKLHEILEPFSPDERRRVVAAVLTLLGDEGSLEGLGTRKSTSGSATGGKPAEEGAALPSGARQWMNKNSLSVETLEHYFHFDGGAVTPIELPSNGKSNRERTINTYLMQGIATLLSSGETSFPDETARKLCEHFGCYDPPNHAKYLKNVGNLITGSKSAGWKVTAPGLSAVAALCKTTGA